MERWVGVVGYEGLYEVSSLGRVRGIKRGKILRTHPDRNGYLRVRLSRGGIVTNRVVHRLVCEAFHGPAPEGRPWALHGERGESVNTPDNLRWGTPKDNARDRVRDGNDHKANRTTCLHGHLLDEANTYVRPNGTRACRACRRDRARRYYHERAIA